jgi:hypothetical protein
MRATHFYKVFIVVLILKRNKTLLVDGINFTALQIGIVY